MKIGIIGLGLIGGSLLKVLSGKGFKIVGVTQNRLTKEEAKKYCHICAHSMNSLKDCDVVFVCTPISKTLETLDKLEKIVSKKCIVADVASVKSFVMQKKYPYKFIGSHPMAGIETSGFTGSTANLFEGAKWVLTPSEDVSDSDIETFKNIIGITGAKPVITDAESHDEAVALISHLPMFVAQGLFKNAQDNNLALQLASSGFRDTTRLAMTYRQLAEDMLAYNRENIMKALKSFLNLTENLVNDKDYPEVIAAISHKRRQMYSPDGKNTL